MLISHEYRFIFIKTRKTAGTSIEISLSRFLGAWDVVTPITPRDELQRAVLGVQPRNYLAAVHPTADAKGAVTEESVEQQLGQVQILRRFYNHCPAREIADAVGPRIWNSYTKFCFERNPWDRVISEYAFQQRTQPERYAAMSLDQFIEEGAFSLNYPLYAIDGQVAVNFVGRYESLADDLQSLCQKIGIPYDGWLPQAKRSGQSERCRPRLTPRQIDLIARTCRPEIELLGYQAPSSAAA